MEHTGEPWVTGGRRVLAQPENELGEFEICECGYDSTESMHRSGLIGLEEAEANAQRIADCVTACRGLNPTKALSDSISALAASLEWWHSIPGHMQRKEPTWVAQARDALSRVRAA